MNPLDNAQMTSQIAQINTVTGIQQLNQTMQSMASQFNSLQVMQGTALIGTAGDGPDLVVGSGEAAWIGLDDGPARMRVDGTVHRVTVGES